MPFSSHNDNAAHESSHPQNNLFPPPKTGNDDDCGRMVRGPVFMSGALSDEPVVKKTPMKSALKEKAQQQRMAAEEEKSKRARSQRQEIPPNADFIELSDVDSISGCDNSAPQFQQPFSTPRRDLVKIKQELMDSAYGEMPNNDDDADDEEEDEEEGEDKEQKHKEDAIEEDGEEAEEEIFKQSPQAEQEKTAKVESSEALKQISAPRTTPSRISTPYATSKAGRLSQSLVANQENHPASCPPNFRVPPSISSHSKRSHSTQLPNRVSGLEKHDSNSLKKQRTHAGSLSRAASHFNIHTDRSTSSSTFHHNADPSVSMNGSNSSPKKVGTVTTSPNDRQEDASQTSHTGRDHNNFGHKGYLAREDKNHSCGSSDDEGLSAETLADGSGEENEGPAEPAQERDDDFHPGTSDEESDDSGDGSPNSDRVLRSLPSTPAKMDAKDHAQTSMNKKNLDEIRVRGKRRVASGSSTLSISSDSVGMMRKIQSSIMKKREDMGRLEQGLRDLRHESSKLSTPTHSDLTAKIQSSLAKKQQDKLKVEGKLRGILKNSSSPGNSSSKKRDHAHFAEDTTLIGEPTASSQGDIPTKVARIANQDVSPQVQNTLNRTSSSGAIPKASPSGVSSSTNKIGDVCISSVGSLSPSELTPMGTRTLTSIQRQPSPTPVHPEFDDYDFTTLLPDFDVSDIIGTSKPVRRRLFDPPPSTEQTATSTQVVEPGDSGNSKHGQTEDPKMKPLPKKKRPRGCKKSRKARADQRVICVKLPGPFSSGQSASATQANNNESANPDPASARQAQVSREVREEQREVSQAIVEAAKLRKAENRKRRRARKEAQIKEANNAKESIRDNVAFATGGKNDKHEQHPSNFTHRSERNEKGKSKNIETPTSTEQAASEAMARHGIPTTNTAIGEEARGTASKKRRHNDDSSECTETTDEALPPFKYRKTSSCVHSIARGPGQHPISTADAVDFGNAIKGMWILQNGLVQLSAKIRPVADAWRSYAEDLQESTGYNFLDIFEHIQSSVYEGEVAEQLRQAEEMRKIMEMETEKMAEEDELDENALRELDCDCVWDGTISQRQHMGEVNTDNKHYDRMNTLQG